MVSKAFIRGMGIAFFIIGILGAIGFITTLEDVPSYVEVETDNVAIWIKAIASLVGCSAIGTLFLALERIIHGVENKGG